MAVSKSVWLLTMSNGGLYESADLGGTWQRLDTASEQGEAAGVLAVPNYGFLVASQSEGFLGFQSDASSRH
jgi:hypothetical protein